MAASAPFARAPSVPSAVGLVVANLVPLVGVLFFGWSLFGVMWLYWAENGVIGAFALLRILTAGEGHGQKLVMAPFFAVHFGLFWTVHGVFVVSTFGDDVGLWDPTLQVEGLVALVLSHGASFVLNYLARGEWKTTTPGAEMFKPYGRVVLLHLVILLGGFLVGLSGSGVLALAILVVLKTGLDLAVHLAGHWMRLRDEDVPPPDPEPRTLRLDAVPERAPDRATPLALRDGDR
ncbi:DUF6498-containing protein [Rubrivirga marina]|uniref:Uncharacterized protein n=1 Tax=Rubrivirga marina TaxID=1196024 RepID=A0A271J4L6_9BACT|nr:DUF6498-containing protein [Rubrivirga marina]PAP78471.1 hypothetical protein BSZ37_19590 [Rubrivirga marina]